MEKSDEEAETKNCGACSRAAKAGGTDCHKLIGLSAQAGRPVELYYIALDATALEDLAGDICAGVRELLCLSDMACDGIKKGIDFKRLDMTEIKKQGRLRIELSARQKVWLGVLLVALVGGLGYGWYYWQGLKQAENLPKAGINMALPGAKLDKVDPVDKMAYYELAKRDSARRDTGALGVSVGRPGFGKTEDEQTRKINERLASINQVLSSPAPAAPLVSGHYGIGSGGLQGSGATVGVGSAPIGKDVDRLEQLIKTMDAGKEADPEMEQLGTMMDKLLALQNPALAGELLKAKGDRTGLGTGSDNALVRDSLFRAVPAVVSVNQRPRQGSVVELRLVDTMKVSGQVIPSGHLVYGLASFSNQRLNLEIRSIRLGSSIVPVNLSVFDRRDGMPGINAPDALVRDAVSGGVSSASGSIGLTGFDLGTQLAGAGIDAARSLLNKKVSRLSQKLRAGYPLLLRDNTVKRKQ